MSGIRKFLRFKNSDGISICRVSDLIEQGFDPKWLSSEFVRLNKEVWKDITDSRYLWTEEMVRSHFRICPELIYCAFENGTLVATLTNIKTVEADMRKNKTWLEKTGEGFLTTHRPDGDIGFGVDLSVSRKASKGVSDGIVRAGLFISVFGEGVKAVYLGSRIPGYHKNRNLTVQEYVFGRRKSAKPLDPELYFYLKHGFQIIDIIPEYMDDPESLNYGVLIKWDNPFYLLTRTLPFIKYVIRVVTKFFLLS